MTPQELAARKRIIYALIVLGFVGLIGAHEIAPNDPNANMGWPLILAGIGTACFIAAALMGRNLMKHLRSR